MNPTENSRSPIIIAVAVVLLAAAISWKFFYSDPHSELASLKSQTAEATAAQPAPQPSPQLYTADKETIAAAASANKKISPKDLRKVAVQSAKAVGLKQVQVGGSGTTISISASGPSAAIDKYLSSLQGSLHIEDHQIRGSGPFVQVSGVTITGDTPDAESLHLQVSSGP